MYDRLNLSKPGTFIDGKCHGTSWPLYQGHPGDFLVVLTPDKVKAFRAEVAVAAPGAGRGWWERYVRQGVGPPAVRAPGPPRPPGQARLAHDPTAQPRL